jgi:hypothetical protein
MLLDFTRGVFSYAAVNITDSDYFIEIYVD